MKSIVRVTLIKTREVQMAVEHEEDEEATDLTDAEEARARDLAADIWSDDSYGYEIEDVELVKP